MTFKVLSDVIAQLLGMPHDLELFATMEPIEAERAPNVGPFVSANGLMDFYVEGDQLQGGDDSEDLYHDENFFILIGKQRM